MIYRSEQEKYSAIAQEIEGLNKWDEVETTDRKDFIGQILNETEDAIVFQPKGSKSKQTIPRDKIAFLQKRGRPVLVGTVSIEKSEKVSAALERRGIPHEVLNAKHHEREAEIVAQAGRKGAVTIATNMAGRGTDIVLGGNPETMAWALLQDKYETRLDVPKDEWETLIESIRTARKYGDRGRRTSRTRRTCISSAPNGTKRAASILQLRGRSGRQGDPGSSRFYLSLEDDLMRIFAGEWVRNVLTRLGMKEGEAIESKMVSRRIEGAQKESRRTQLRNPQKSARIRRSDGRAAKASL